MPLTCDSSACEAPSCVRTHIDPKMEASTPAPAKCSGNASPASPCSANLWDVVALSVTKTASNVFPP